MKKGLILLVLFSVLVFSQQKEIKVIAITNENFLLLSDSTVARLVDLYLPWKYNLNPVLQSIGEEVNIVLNQLLTGKNIELTDFPSHNNIRRVRVKIGRLFYSIDPAEKLLKKGLAKLEGNLISDRQQEYKEFEQLGRINKRGVWSPECLKTDLETAGISEEEHSKLFFELKRKRLESIGFPQITTGKLMGEVLVSPLGLIGGFFTGGLIGVAFKKDLEIIEGEFNINKSPFIGATIGTIIGTATSVYFMAKSYDPNLSYSGTVLAGIGGGLIGTGLAYLIEQDSYFGSSFWLIPLGSVLGSILYTNLWSSSLQQKAVTTEEREFLNRYKISHNDIFNSEKLVEVELFRIGL